MSSTSRNINLDLLKSTIMFFIVIWHSIVHGLNIASSPNTHILVNFDTTTSFFNAFAVKLLMYITSIGVNCFILITGHFMINYNKNIWPRIIKIWGLTSFYSLLISFLFYINNLTLYGIGGVIFTAFPIYNGEYWFITKYLGLILLAPFLEQLANILTQRDYLKGIIILSFLTIYIPPLLNYGNTYSSANDLLFFINLFFIGGYISKYNSFSSNINLLYVFILIVFLLTIYDFMNEITYIYLDKKLSNNSTTFILSIIFFLFFKNYKFKTSKFTNFIVNNITPYTLGVYLIHENDEIRKHLWKSLNLIQYYESEYFIIILLLYSLFIFCICTLFDYFRKYIVNIFQIDRFINKYIDKISNKLFKSFT